MSEAASPVLGRKDRSLLEAALGDDVLRHLADVNVSDILVRPWGISIDTFDRGLVSTGIVPSPGQIDGALRAISGLVRATLNESHPVLECKLAYEGGARVAGILYGEGESFYTLRRHREIPVTLADYDTRQVGNEEGYGRDKRESEDASKDGARTAVDAVRSLLRMKTSLLISGPTGSGKTTLLQACVGELAHIEDNAHYVFIEDTPELSCTAPHRTFMRTTPALSMRDLVRAALRHRPTWIIAGEVRGGEALDIVNAGITGHPILATVHASSTGAALKRIVSAMGEVVRTVDHSRIVDAFGGVISVRRRRAKDGGNSYVITEVVRVDDVTGSKFLLRSALD